MSNYNKMIHLFEAFKDELSEEDLQFVLTLIQEYDTCRGAQEADEIERKIIEFCENKERTNT